MNIMNAVLGAPCSSGTTPPSLSSPGGTTPVRGNGSATGQHTTAVADGYLQLNAQGSSCSSSTASSASSESSEEQPSTRLTFPHQQSLWAHQNGIGSEEIGSSSESNDFRTSSSLDLSNPNINAEHSSGDNLAEQFFYSVQSLENDLDYILENRDLNPFYEESVTPKYEEGAPNMDKWSVDDDEDDGVFNVEDYLVDLDQYLEEQELKAESGQVASGNPNQRIVRKPNTNQTLPRNLSSQRSTLKRNAAIRSSVHLGKEQTDDLSIKPRRRSLWLRNSMRRTKLISMPNQVDVRRFEGNTFQTASAARDEGDGEGSCLVPTLNVLPSSSAPVVNSTVESPPTMDDFMTFNRVTFNPNAQRPQTNQIHEERLRYSEPPQPVSSSNLRATSTLVTATQQYEFPDPSAPPLDDFVTPNSPVTPRQFGRRTDQSPRIIAINAESNTIVIGNINSRPTSAPAGLIQSGNDNLRRSVRDTRHPNRSEFDSMSSVASSRNESPVSLESSSGSSVTSTQNEPADRTASNPMGTDTSNRSPDDQNDRNRQSAVTTTSSSSSRAELPQEDPEMKSKFWPHDLGSALAIISCTLGVFNMSRFAVFSVHFGANFMVQFLILSVIFGIPMLWLQMCLGAKIQRGPAAMWKISPISRGIGIVLLFVQGIIGLYSAISISWLLVYFRDSFVNNTDRYKWQDTVEMYRPGGSNESVTLAQTIPDYFNGVVLQRYNLGHAGRVGLNSIGKVRFQLAFNLSLFWTFVFIILCRGLRSYGKFVFPMIILPILGLTVFSMKLLMIIDFSSLENLFPATDWDDFFVNSHSWMTAAQEIFLTWGLFGASVLSMSSHGMKRKGSLVSLRRDAFFVVIVTLYGLMLAGVIGNVCMQIIRDNGYLYYPGSYETLSSNVFLYPVSQPIPTNVISIPAKWLPRYSTVLGEAMKQPGTPFHKESGYQVLRLITEFIPAAFGAATQELISPWWCLLGITSLLLLAVAQFCAIWRPISTVLGSNPSSVLLSCVTGLLLGIPLSTEMGLQIVYFLETTVGGAWWLLIIWFGQIIALFLIRGRPYTGDLIVKDMKFGNTVSTFIALSWNIIIPVGLMFLCVFQYQVTDMSKFLHWKGVSYWPLWARKVGGIIQISILQIIPVTAVLQIYRFLSKGPPDILDRVTLLYRPGAEVINRQASTERTRNAERLSPSPPLTTISLDVPVTPVVPEDVPPKYTPPPSYTTATGARIAKMLRQSIRRSVRRIMGEPSNLSDRLSGLNSGLGSRNFEVSCSSGTHIGPPSYASVNIDLSLNTLTSLVPPPTSASVGTPSVYSMANSSHHHIPLGGGPKGIRPATSPTTPTHNNCVPNFLRPLQSNRSLSLGGCMEPNLARNSFRSNFFNRSPPQSRSLENLVLNPAAMGHSQSPVVVLNHNDGGGVVTEDELQRGVRGRQD